MYPAHWAELTPDKPAVVLAETGETLSYAELDLHSRQLANAFTDLGYVPGDHIAVLLDNTPRYFEILWAALIAGLHVTPISAHATVQDAAYILADSGARALLTSDRLSATARTLPDLVPSCVHWLMLGEPEPGFDLYDEVLARARQDPLPVDSPMGEYMLYSSGSTGRPKGVVRSPSGRTVDQGSIANRFLSKVFGIDEHSVYLSPSPLYHGAPLGFTVGTTSLGGTAVIMQKFDAAGALRAIESYRVTHSQWVPTMFNRLLALEDDVRRSSDLSSQRVAIHSAAPCPVHVKEAMMAWWGPILHEYYSGTEDVGVTYARPQDWLSHPGTVGRPLGATLHICNEAGEVLPTGQAGLVYFERRGTAFEYHKDKVKTRKSRHPAHPTWVTLDDIGYLDEDGFLYLTDRASFMIISGGVNVYPQEVEAVLLRHPAVGDAAVIGLPDTDLGEQVVAVVEPLAGAAAGPELEADLNDFARTHLAGPKRPRSYIFVDILPRQATGKLAKRELQAKYAES